MSKSTPFAREDVMEAYLDSLLHGPDDPADVTARTARLLEQATVDIAGNAQGVATDISAEEAEIESRVNQAIEEQEEAAPVIEAAPVKHIPLSEQLDNRFQALFFEVAGLTLAVPLTTLGGIHRLEKIGPLFGKPSWFKGVMLYREEKLNVVDTAMWVMPEKYNQNLAETLNYQYLIMLGESNWGLASDKLVNNVTLNKDDVKWRESSGKRPWLAGMVKERMCALIDVYQLISMLNNGLGSNDQTP